MTIDFEGCKERFDKKSDEFRDLRAKVDSIVAEKVKFETEAKKAAEQLEKAKEQASKQKETNKRLETDIEGEVKKRVEEVVL